MSEGALRSLSVTKIAAAMRCPLAFKFRYIDKIPERSVRILIAGRTAHTLLEKALRQVLLGAPLPSAKDMDDWFGTEWEAQTKEEETKENFVGWEDDKEDLGGMREDYRGLVRLARNEVLPTIKPRFVEHKIQFEMDSPVGPFPIYGVVDLLEDGGRITDWKTVDKPPKPNEKPGVQEMGYAFWHGAFTGMEITPYRKLYLIRQKKPRVAWTEFSLHKGHREWFAQVAAEVWRMAHHGVFVPSTGGWWCSPKYCNYWDGCQGEL